MQKSHITARESDEFNACRQAHTRMQFSFPRDPKDAQFLELMIAGDGTHLITVDNDLLALNAGRDDAAMRFRQRTHGALVVTPDEFLAKYEKPPE